jgi:putative restriction endonuclease
MSAEPLARHGTSIRTCRGPGVDPRCRLRVSPRLREESGNGEQFYERAGQPIALPARQADRPCGEFLEWHLDTVFMAS